jgi:5'-nucleotidase
MRLTIPPPSASVALAFALALPGCSGESRLPQPARVTVQLLSFNDFHGSLEPSGEAIYDAAAPDGGTLAGGAGSFAALLFRLKAQAPERTVVVAAGDLVGGSPLASALFHDEPTIELMNRVGLDLSSIGNHELDHGQAELLRLQEGGCHPTDGCVFDPSFGGARFRYLAANVVRDPDTGETLVPAYALKRVAGVTVGFVGLTLAGTASLVPSSGIAGLGFAPEAETVNALVPRLRALGAAAIVVLVHQGGFAPPRQDVSGCNLRGEILPIVAALDPGVDVVVSGHTHAAYVCPNVAGKLLTSAASHGRVITEIWLTVDPEKRVVLSKSAENRIVYRTGDEDAEAREIAERAIRGAAPLAGRIIGRIAGALERSANAAGESALGDVLADAQLAATRAPPAAAEVALMNPGGIRADLGDGAGEVRYGQAFAVQPFGNTLVTLTLSGAQLRALLEQQWPPGRSARVLAVSASFRYAYRASAPAGSKVDPASMRIRGAAVDPTAAYRLTVNSFLADGADGFTLLAEGTGRVGGMVDVDALAEHLRPTLTGPPLPVPPLERIVRSP